METLVKAIRIANKQLQQEEADKLGICNRHYARIETGKLLPSRKLGARMVALYGKPLNDLLGHYEMVIPN